MVLPVSAATTQVVSNGSFEPALAGWSQAGAAINPAGTTCGWNSASPAPGTEAISATPGFAATDGTANAVGSSTQTNPGQVSCVLYQDVTIPAGATAANFIADIGIRYLGGKTWNNAAIFYALYSTASVPNYNSARLITFGLFAREPAASDAALVRVSANGVNVAAVAGQTVRLAFINASDSAVGFSVAGVDNVSLIVTTPDPVSTAIPTLSTWAMILLGGLLALFAARRFGHS
jgi:hypothetical protein